MSAETERLALYRCALGVAQEAIEGFTAPKADTSDFGGLKVALAAVRQVMSGDGLRHPAESPALREVDRLKAVNAELAESLTFCAAALRHALAVMPIDDPLLRKTEAIEQAARAALDKHQQESA